MNPPKQTDHPWNLTPAEAKSVQERLAAVVVLEDRLGKVNRVAGTDVGFEDRGRTTRAAVVVMSFPNLEVLESAVIRRPTTFPYVPGYLSFRELPAVLEAFERIASLPDLVLCDGQGIAHPRRFGIACHLGVLLDLPTIGVAKSRLIGASAEPGGRRGQRAPLRHAGERIGTVLRTRDGVKPVYVSPGHRVSMESAVEWVLRCTPKFRLPEPIRAADRLASSR